MTKISEWISNLNAEITMELIVAIMIIAVLDIFSPLFSYIIIKIFNFKSKTNDIKKNPFYKPLKSFFRVLGIYIAIIYLKPVLGISEEVMQTTTKIFKIIVILTTAIGLAQSITSDSIFIKRIKDKSDKEMGKSTINFIVKIIRAVIYIIAGFMIISELGYNLGGLVTGLGLGSVVLTLAAQDTLKNLFSGIMIALDDPFKVGEYIKFDNFEGTVEDITFRSTRLRTLENTVAQVPNSVISNTTVINVSRMKKRLFNFELNIVFETDLNKLRILQNKILSYLSNNEMVIKDSANVYLKNVNINSYNLSGYCYLDVTDYDEYWAVQSELNYGIMNVVNNSDVELAHDTKIIKVGK